MTVPMGNNSAKRYRCYYDREGRQVGMDVEAVSVTSSPTLTAGSSGSNTRFFYDNSRNRVKLITKSGSAYYFVYDPTASVPAVVYEATGTTAYMNTREPSGALISREKYEDGDLIYSRTYHFDGLGSTIALTDEDGVSTDTYSYDAWGNATHTSGTTADNPYQYVGELGYYTHWQEPTLKLLQLGGRYYDPSVGRFTQRDPIQDGLNWYIYASNNPLVSVDPSGEIDYNPSFRNKLSVYPYNNCYTYAVNDPRPPGTGLQPGNISGNKYDNQPNGDNTSRSCTNLIANAIRDYGLKEQKKEGGCSAGWHKVCLFIDADGHVPSAYPELQYDYHWYRQDGDGTWSNKHGNTPVIGGIADPEADASLWGYEKKCPDPSGRDWCMCAKDKPWAK